MKLITPEWITAEIKLMLLSTRKTGIFLSTPSQHSDNKNLFQLQVTHSWALQGILFSLVASKHQRRWQTYEYLLQSAPASVTKWVLESNINRIRETEQCIRQVIGLLSQLSAESNVKLFHISSRRIVSSYRQHSLQSSYTLPLSKGPRLDIRRGWYGHIRNIQSKQSKIKTHTQHFSFRLDLIVFITSKCFALGSQCER